MQFVLIAAGEFMMGSLDDEIDRKSDEVSHRVHVTLDFYFGKYEVTQSEWAKIMGENPSHFKNCGSRCPVECVSWYEVRSFIAKLNEISAGENFRLPTEAEWEYACRAGTATPFSTGKNLTTDQAKNARSARRYTHAPHDRGFGLGFRLVREIAVYS